MRKITTTFALVLALSFFCSFVSHAGTNGYIKVTLDGTLSDDKLQYVFTPPKQTVHNQYNNFDAGGGANSFYVSDSVTFEYTLKTYDMTDSLLADLYCFYFENSVPTISVKNKTSDFYESDVYIKNVSYYLVANGEKYELGENTWEYIYPDKLRSRVNIIVEVDFLVFVTGAYTVGSTPGCEYFEFDIECSAFRAIVKKTSMLSEYGLLQTINKNTTTLLSDLKIYFTQLFSKLTTWFDRQHTDLTNANSKLQSLISSLSSYRTEFGNYANQQHQDMIDLGEKLANEYDDSDANDTASDFEDITSDLDEIQGGIVTDATDGLGEYTLDSENGIKALYGVSIGAALVSSMLQSIFETTPAIGVLISVTFSMVLACMLVGLFRYFKR